MDGASKGKEAMIYLLRLEGQKGETRAPDTRMMAMIGISFMLGIGRRTRCSKVSDTTLDGVIVDLQPA